MTPGLQVRMAFIPIGLSGPLPVGLGWAAEAGDAAGLRGDRGDRAVRLGCQPQPRIAAATLEGLIITVQELWIIFGAMRERSATA